MKQIYLIHSHNHLAFLNYLINWLSSPQTLVYVNIDKKSSLDCSQINPKARLIKKRVSINWGAWSQCEATLNSLRQINAEQAAYGHIIFLSGQDLPVYTTEYIAGQLQPGKQYINCTPINTDWPQAKNRFRHFHWAELSRLYIRRPGFAGFAGKVVYKSGYYLFNGLYRAVKGRWRTLPLNMEAYGGSQWWMLERNCINYILEHIDRHPELISFFRTTFCSDELFFQTLIMNSPFRDQVAPYLRYIDWANSPDGKSPKVLLRSDYEAIKASGALLCRKTDPEKSLELINHIAATNSQPPFSML
ncbi:MAG: hypothetical protein EOP54_12325 [Sphingobacteriales bacterium]|nr:MAG: hypothetical protein EOP54_12325 [Sphingobacteriales bacterium]